MEVDRNGRAVSIYTTGLLFYSLSILVSETSAAFRCNATSTCVSMVGYNPSNRTSVSSIKRLFGLKTHHELLAANNWPLSHPNRSVLAGSEVRVPVPCKCDNGTGISNRRPGYNVKRGQTLHIIAKEVFAGLVTPEAIAAANGIRNLSVIEIGQALWIPLPCSCDAVEGEIVVHYAYFVAAGSTLAQIAGKFWRTESTLMAVNGISDPKELKAGDILDVPLRVCSSSMDNSSLDGSLLVPNGSHAVTANNCVECSCNSDDLKLRCKHAQKVKISNWKQCPSMQCFGNLTLGENMTDSCSLTTCAYAGYTKEKIITVLTNQSRCPFSEVSGSESSDINAGEVERSWSWGGLFISVITALFYF